MMRHEGPPGEPAAGEPKKTRGQADLELVQKYGRVYIEVQRAIIAQLPTEQERLDWAETYGGTFHDLAAADPAFHELVMAEKPDIEEIKKRVEGVREL